MIPLYKPFMPELPEMDAILHSGAIAYGKKTRQFEDSLRDFFGVSRLFATNSFNTAISVAAAALDLRHDDEVIVSPMACLASTQPYASEGLKIVWADVDNHLGTLNPESVRSKITSKTKAIIHNHFCGYPGYIDEINQIGREYGIPVIDDGIECFGSEYKGQKIGNCGTDITVFSFNPVRIPTTIDGGAVLFSGESRFQKGLLARDCGIDRSRFRDDLGEISAKCDISMIGYSATMSDVNGYIGCQTMPQIESILDAQRRQAQKWDAYFEEHRDFTPLPSGENRPNYWVYGILAPEKREAIRQFREQGYYASGVHINNNIYSVFGDYVPLPGVDDFYRHFVALPCGWWMESNR